MNTDSDNQLLESYAACGSEHCFRELVERRIHLVYSAALRESRGDAPQAEDITQAVFSELARNAKRLARHPALSGWLYTCVRRMAANVRRAEHRRQRREQEAFTMNQFLPDPTSNLWLQVRPVLDDVMHELNEDDRTAVVLRFFEGRSLKEVGLALGTTENAARMRVERALEKLRGFLSQRGVKSTASTLAAVITAGAVLTAPPSLAATVATGALTVAATGTLGALTLAKVLGLAKTKAAAGAALLALIAAVTLLHQVHSRHAANQQPQATNPADAASGEGAPGLEDKSAATTPAPTNAAVPQMILRVLEAETGKSLPNTKLYLFYLFEDGRGKVIRKATGAGGKLAVDTPQAPFYGLNMFVTADGHVPKVTSWGFGRSMPAEYTMKLERGITIGGVVVDEQGQPIDRAKIEVDNPGNDMASQENIQFGPDAVSHTDPTGHWSCSMIPEHVEQVSLVITHPEYAETQAKVRPNTPDATNSIITMKMGISVAGIVQDSNGNPVAGAKVREVRLNSEGERSQKTDGTGVFEFRNMNKGDLMLGAQAEGFAPALQTLQVTGNTASILFKLGPGQLLKGRLVDENGNPVTNAFAEITRRDIDRVQWSTNSDSEGRFEWHSAPPEPLLYSFLAEGFNHVYALSLKADGSDHEIKLTRKQPGKDTIQITGTVQDADTGQPLHGFKVLFARVEPDWAVPFDFATVGTNGAFVWAPSSGSLHTNYQLQIEMEGYLPALSTNLSVNDGNQALEFKLQKGSGPSGVVLLPGGEPAPNATVFLCVPQAGVTLNGSARVEKGLNTSTYCAQTDEAGKFSLAPAAHPQGVVVVHDQGYAQLSLAELKPGGTITLQPWGRIDGRVMLDSQPVPNENVRASSHVFRYDERGRPVTLLTMGLDTKTDASGKFTFEKVPPGDCTVFREKKSPREPSSFFSSHTVSARVSPGTITQVVLGGNGRAVIGTASWPGAIGTFDWQNVPVRLSLKLADELGPYPRRHDFSSNEAFMTVMSKWEQTRRAQRSFVTFCESNGSFRLQDIPAGTYRLEIKLRESKSDSVAARNRWEPEPEIASIVREVTVPATGGDQSVDPLDLGSLELVPGPGRTTARSQ